MSKYKLVPTELTKKMFEEFGCERYFGCNSFEQAQKMWDNILSASPCVDKDGIRDDKNWSHNLCGGTIESHTEFLLTGHKRIFNQHPSKRSLQNHIKRLYGMLTEQVFKSDIAEAEKECRLERDVGSEPEKIMELYEHNKALVKALERISGMDSMSYHSLDSAMIVARDALSVYREQGINHENQ